MTTILSFSNAVNLALHLIVLSATCPVKLSVSPSDAGRTEADSILKQRLYMYIWHPSMSTSRGQKVFRTVLDENGRFAISIPSSWTTLHVRTESGLWKKLFLDGEPVVVPGGTPTAEAAFNYIAWNTFSGVGTAPWNDLSLCYGDVDGNNAISYSGSDASTVSARINAAVRVTVHSGTASTYNYNHLVDLNRDNVVDAFDDDILELSSPSSGSFAGAAQ